jgi:hypothetical protein
MRKNVNGKGKDSSSRNPRERPHKSRVIQLQDRQMLVYAPPCNLRFT